MDACKQLKPLFVVKPGSVSRKDIMRAERHSGICIVECAEPEAARYQELPIMHNLDDQARAALSLLRMVIHSQSVDFKRAELTKWFVQQLLEGHSPAQVLPTKTVSR